MSSVEYMVGVKSDEILAAANESAFVDQNTDIKLAGGIQFVNVSAASGQ
jgi:hypothetical protein